VAAARVGIPPLDRRESRLDLRTKLLYAAGDIPNSVKTTTAALFGFYFYTSVMGLPATLAGLAAGIGLVWDAGIDPYIGHLSDNARGRWGRRHGFMLAGAVTMGLGFWASFAPPHGMSTAGLFLWLLGTGFLVRTTTSLYRVPYLALGAELSRDYDERTAITAFRGFLAVVGALAAGGLSFLLFFPNRTSGVDPKLDYAGYPAMGLAFGIVMTLLGLLTTAGTWSWRHVAAAEDGYDAPRRRRFLAGFAQCLRRRSFRALFASSSLFFLAISMNAALSIHFLTHYARVTDSRALSAFQIAYWIAGLAGVVVWLRVSRKMEKHSLYLLGTVATAAAMLAVFLLVGEGHLLGAGNVRALLAGHALVGFFGSTLWFVPATLIADVVDEDELATGARREGAFFGLFSFGQQVAAGAALLLTGVLVERFAGLVPGQAVPTARTVWRIGLLYGALPAVLTLAAAAVVLPYRVGRREMAAIQAQLCRRRSDGAARGAGDATDDELACATMALPPRGAP
jgi:glycoside/pentoside/hexuronide:cation symporter, GPH family